MGKVWSDPGPSKSWHHFTHFTKSKLMSKRAKWQSIRPEFVTFSSSINYSQIFPVVRVTGWHCGQLHPRQCFMWWVQSPLPPLPELDCAPGAQRPSWPPFLRAPKHWGTRFSASNWKATFESQDRSVLQDWRGLVWIVKVENMDPERCHLPARRSDVVLRDWTSFSHFAAYLLSKLGLLTP